MMCFDKHFNQNNSNYVLHVLYLCLLLHINISYYFIQGDVLKDGKVKRIKYLRDPSGKDKARNVDKYARKLFPLCFILFNIVYWTSNVLWNYGGN